MKTALIVLDLINDIVTSNGKLGAATTAVQAESRAIIDKPMLQLRSPAAKAGQSFS
ncbi:MULTISPECIES: hypothetical protein [Paraburkholderia]|uniref:hypothetical protein n=1 Tax=Paraburkholderia TaxID=1822464 RepID=UPI0022539298|nr:MULTISPECIES: hypothetical protein [Paraburkholderia]MCX4159671.1 hypothetical protein [Paraburkholderia aspalathi]MDN7169068.1 hypothetical protein [Paraburkholderia sp. SECH2]MDQ6397556.1 hypothetical protein [Paraburkholderia aspalathi]